MSNGAMGPAAKKVRRLEVAGASGNAVESKDTKIQKALEEIDACQNEIDALNEKASEEILVVEQKYNKLRKPYFHKRNDIIKRIPNFWFTAFVNHPQISAILEEDEENCLHYLTKLEVEEFDDISGDRINFYFEENPYFENDVLTKEFNLVSLGDPASQSMIIHWKEGHNLTEKKSKDKSGGKGRKRFMEQKTLFGWLVAHADPFVDVIAEVIKDYMWQNPLQYYRVPDIEVANGVEGQEDGSEDEDAELAEVEEEEDLEGDEGSGENLAEEDDDESTKAKD